MTFYDATEMREEQLKAHRAASITRAIVDTVRDPLVILDEQLRITTAAATSSRCLAMPRPT